MAVSTQASQKVWTKVKSALQGVSVQANPAVAMALKGLKEYLASQGKNPDLQIFHYSAADAAGAGGKVLLSGAATLYAFFAQKTSAATRNTIKIYDDASDDTTAGDAVAAIDLIAASQDGLVVFPTGYLLAAGIVVTAHTTLIGTTDGSSANAANGFIIVGA